MERKTTQSILTARKECDYAWLYDEGKETAFYEQRYRNDLTGFYYNKPQGNSSLIVVKENDYLQFVLY